MMRQFELVERVKAYDPSADEDALNRAYVFSMKAHGAQMRASGDPYFSHPVEVAGILSGMKLDTASIITGLLHDTVEDTRRDARRDRAAVRPRDRAPGRRRHQAVAPRAAIRPDQAGGEFPQAGAGDVRGHPRAAGQARRPAAQHAHAAFHQGRGQAPAHRARDHGNLCAAGRAHRHARDEGRARGSGLRRALSRRAREHHARGSSSCARRAATWSAASSTSCSETLKKAGIEAQLSGREKTPYSIWRKMQRKNVGFEQLSDIMAFRVVVDDVERVLSRAGRASTAAIRSCPGRFKDYISTPKPNNYRSLHTGVIGPERQRIEVQIRTREMHEVAELGVAAHWVYKQGAAPSTEGRQYRWLRELLDILEHASDPAGIPRAHQARDVPGPGLLLHAQGRSDRSCRAAPRRSISPMPSIPRSATPASAPRSTAGWCRCAPQLVQRRPGRDRHLQGADAVARPGSASSSPARRARASAASSAPSSASNISTSARRSCKRPSARRATNSPRRRSTRC